MEKRKRVAIYGNSLNIAGIVAALKANTTLEVFCLNLDSPNARQILDVNDLAAIVIDLGDPSVRLDVSLLHGRPGMLLIGVDPSMDEMLVLFSQPVRALHIADLVNVIHHQGFSAVPFLKRTMQ